MSGTTPDLGTAWRLLDETRAELEKVTAERDRLRELLNEAGIAEPYEPVIMGAGVEHLLLDGA